MQTVNVLVHINETLDPTILDTIEADVCNCTGVLTAAHWSDKPHLMRVSYDTERTRMSEIVDEIQHHRLHAHSIGLL